MRTTNKILPIIRRRDAAGRGGAAAHVDGRRAIETKGVTLEGGGGALLEPDVVEARKGDRLPAAVEVLDDPVCVLAAEGRAVDEGYCRGDVAGEVD